MHRRSFLATLATAAGAAGLPAGSLGAVSPDAAGSRSERFLRAVIAGDAARVRTMLAEDGSLAYARDRQARSAYVLAHLNGHLDVAGILADQGILMDVVEATLARDWDRVDAIGATSPGVFNADHPVGGTALWAAAWSGVGRDMWRLQQYGADPDANPRGAEGETPVRAAVGVADPLVALDAASHLLGNAGTANPPQRGGSSVLHGAAASGDVHLVRLVLRKGGDPDARDDAGRTPLDVAEAGGHEAAAALLRNPGVVARDHRTSRFAWRADGTAYEAPSLMGAHPRFVNETVGVSHSNLEAAQRLVDRQPELAHSVSYVDEGAVEACAHTGRRPIVAYLLERGAPYSLPTAATMGDLAWARRLLAEDPLRVHERGAHDFALMWYPVIGGGLVEMAELFLDHGADIEQEQAGTTGLHWAARAGQADLVAFLLERGADPDAVGRRFRLEGETPLDHATEREHDRVVEVLEAGGARLRVATGG